MKNKALIILYSLMSISFSKLGYAENFTKFMKDFSIYCINGISSTMHYQEMAKLEGWKVLSNDQKVLLRNSKGNDFDGYVYKGNARASIFMIGFGSVKEKGKMIHTCSLVNFASDYKTNVKQMIKHFNAKRLEDFHMGVQYMEVFSIDLPTYNKSIITTSQDKSQSQGKDLFKFDLVVYE
tara:strand:+ start:160 stop:699 length:540 start_codon:yes stop_codon:yes gene_type:complete